jgi:D-sedoheptulose 7-phosphate isomerase
VTQSFTEQMAEHQQAVAAATQHVDLLETIAKRIIQCFEGGGRLYLAGNGGSAADAQHIAAELVGRFKHDHKPLPATALTTDTSVLTAVANDLGADNCFSRQVAAHMTDKDLLWALSVSGTSPNVVRALDKAKSIGAETIGFTGQGGGRFVELCDVCFQVAHNASDRVQEVHQLAYHLICDRVEQRFMV